MKKFALLLCFAFCLLFSNSIQAQQPDFSSKYSDVYIYHDGKGKAIVNIKIAPDWHIGASNPGDAGYPTIFKTDNNNLILLNQSLPQTKKLFDVMNLYYYENEAFFELKTDKKSEITLEYAECNDVCRPLQYSFNLSTKHTDNKKWKKISEQAQQTFPLVLQQQTDEHLPQIQLDTEYNGEIIFIPQQNDTIAPNSLQIEGNKIRWQHLPHQHLTKAFIITPEHSYAINITYKNNITALLYIIFLAFIGGIILNAMPCVFPVLSLKIFALLNSCKQPYKPWKSALFYVLGVLTSFLLLTTIIITLKAQGENIGWGFQLQSSTFVGIMAVIFMLLFLFMMEWLHFPHIAGKYLQKISQANDFTTGFFAVLIASPCTGPFMGAAIGYAFMRSNVEIIAVFTALAIGYALPYALIELYPQTLRKILPHPGKWMRYLKIAFAIPVLLTSIWLGNIFYQQIRENEENIKQELHWQAFDAQEIQNYAAQKENIFIDFTASWCLTCRFNEQLIINTEKFKEFVKKNNVHLFLADMTENNPDYYQALKTYGRESIPLYVYYRQGKMEILPLFFSVKSLEN